MSSRKRPCPRFPVARAAAGGWFPRRVVKYDYSSLLCAELGGYALVLVHKSTFTGRVLSQATYPRAYLGWFDDGAKERIMADFFNRPGPKAKAEAANGSVWADMALQRDCPVLYSFLTSLTWPDGAPRVLGSLVIFAEDGGWKVCLSDRDSSSSLWAAATTFEGLARALEGRLTEASPDWRQAKPRSKRT
jgi:hypothetical protein